MKKIIQKIICLMLLFTSITFVSCSKTSSNKPQSNTDNSTQKDNTNTNNNTNNNTTDSSNNSTSNSNSNEKTFTLDELKKYDGKNGNPAYVAVNGKVYDVTHAEKWKNGKHEDGAVAGTDLTSTIGKSPHGTSVLGDVPIVGILK